MTNKTAQKKRQFLEVLPQKAGMISSACKAVGISRETFYRWLRTDMKFAKQYEEVQESLTDYVEGMLMKKIQEGDTTSIIFYLKTKGKNRGYTERMETQISGSMKNELVIKVVETKDDEKIGGTD